MPALHPYSPRRTSIRQHGTYPHALQRALELQAAYQLIAEYHPARRPEHRRAWLAAFHPRALHGFIARYLTIHPERSWL